PYALRLTVLSLSYTRGRRQDGDRYRSNYHLQHQQGYIRSGPYKRARPMRRSPDGDHGCNDRGTRRPAGTVSNRRPHEPRNRNEGQGVLSLRARKPPHEPRPAGDQQRREQQPRLDLPLDAPSHLRRITPRQEQRGHQQHPDRVAEPSREPDRSVDGGRTYARQGDAGRADAGTHN